MITDNWLCIECGCSVNPFYEIQCCRYGCQGERPATIDTDTVNVLVNMPKLNQRQDSVTDQLRDLYAFANKLGMYDAADFIMKGLK